MEALKLPVSAKTGEMIEEMTIDMNIEYYREVYMKTRESTASSPSGIHYGRYIAARKNELLTKVNLLFMVTPFQVGILLNRWTQSIHCMIKKVERSYVNKLQIVQLYEVYFNTMLKHLMGRRLMVYSEEHSINGHQLFVFRNGRSMYDALVTVRVIYDMARVQRDYLISIFNDFKGCYYIIQPALNTITT